MKFRHLIRLLFYALLVPVLLTMLVLCIYMNSNPEILRRRFPLNDWAPEKSRNLSKSVLPNTRTFLMKPQELGCGGKIFLLVIVCSRIESFRARQRIRNTWANTTDFNYQHFAAQHTHMRGMYLEPSPERLAFYKDYIRIINNAVIDLRVRVIFLVGSNANLSQQKQLRNEQDQYDDIVQQDFVDTYNNLSIKSAMMLKFLTHNYMRRNYAFFMKCDEDVFVNIPNLLHFLLGGTIPVYNSTLSMHDSHSLDVLAALNRLNLTDKVLIGYKFCQVLSVSNVSDKFYVPYYMFEGRVYPPYLSGTSYVMSSDVVPQLYNMALQTPLFHFEDVFLTGICAEHLNLRRYHSPLFTWRGQKYLPKEPCSLKGCITMHWKSKHMLTMYNFVKNVNVKCPTPDKNFDKSILNENTCLSASNRRKSQQTESPTNSD